MARRMRKRWRNRLIVVALIAGVGVLYAADIWPFNDHEPADAPQRPASIARLAGEVPGDRTATESPDEPTGTPQHSIAPAPESGDAFLSRIRADVETGMAALQQGDLLQARELMKGAVGAGLPAPEEEEARRALVDIARRTIFSPERFEGDPLSKMHIVQPGEVLGKLATDYHVTADLIAMINQLRNKNMVRAGQTLKIVPGPVRAVVRRSEHLCLVFLQDVLVAEFPVGLGEHGSTPAGVWVVRNKLDNPTYYPPAARGGRIIPGNDPENPLGEHWIGLEGLSGDAVGQVGYGLHGTIEPDSVGKNVSLGCVRLLNEDVTLLYTMLVEGESKVIIE